MKNLTKNQLNKVIVGFVMSCGVNAMAQSKPIHVKTLIQNRISDSTMQVLLNNKILLQSKNENEFILNNNKVIDVLRNSNDQKAKDFLVWLKKLADDKSSINLKNPADMNFSTQDGGINQRF